MRGYLNGKNAAIAIASTAYPVENWDSTLKLDVVRSRGSGDGAWSRQPVAKDWEFNGTVMVALTQTPPNPVTLLGAEVAIVADTDESPKVRVSGTGLVTEAKITTPAGDNSGNVTIAIKVECSSADIADFLTVTVA